LCDLLLLTPAAAVLPSLCPALGGVRGSPCPTAAVTFPQLLPSLLTANSSADCVPFSFKTKHQPRVRCSQRNCATTKPSLLQLPVSNRKKNCRLRYKSLAARSPTGRAPPRQAGRALRGGKPGGKRSGGRKRRREGQGGHGGRAGRGGACAAAPAPPGSPRAARPGAVRAARAPGRLQKFPGGDGRHGGGGGSGIGSGPAAVSALFGPASPAGPPPARPLTALCFLGRFSDADVDRDPGAAAQELTTALEKNPDDAECYCQRAYAHILLQKYADAVADAKKSLELNPNNAVALLRKGLGEYHIKNYASALESFREGQRLDNVDDTFTIWIKRCEETLNASQTDLNTQQQPLPPKIKYDWYQTESQVIVTIMIKNAQKDDVSVQFLERKMNALVRLPSGEDFNLKLDLLHSIVPEQSTFKVLSTKVEIKMKKPEAVRWEKLEGQGDSLKLKQFTPDTQHLYPSSSHYTRNWDKLVVEIKEEEKNEKLEGDAALNKLFQQIYSDGTDEVKRAMNKSFMESGGTVLSTNWSDVGKRKVEVNPPDDVEWKKF
uniref:SGT1 homolog, MIS12 kinetochore complex assembly cochaperone n=1 Tax=Taeniopygia guttata TaxID=59729 RepID=A0A674HHT9_TAEGU